MKKICIIAVNHKNHKLVFDMFLSIRSNDAEIHFVVVDNSLDSREAEALLIFAESNNNFIPIILEKNEGYFSAINSGLSRIECSSYDYVVIGNNDLIFHEEFFDVLTSKKYGDEYYAICPDVCTIDGFHQNPHVLKKFSILRRLKMDLYYSNFQIAQFLTILKNLFIRRRVNKKINSELIIHMGIGAIYILTPYFFRLNKHLYFPYFLYGEEAFLSKQIISTGGKLLYDPSLIVTHMESATLSLLPGKKKYLLSKQSYNEYKSFL